jgi:hypothetical protein
LIRLSMRPGASCGEDAARITTMDRNERKAAVSAYKERKAVAGVYAIRCAATDEQWIGTAPDLSTIWTRRSFALRQGVEMNRGLQSAWNAHGPESFTFKILEEIDLEQLTYGRERALKERIAHWREALGGAGAV